jgi:FSR family fosmidomycin resistance protein-like MFS transporter
MTHVCPESSPERSTRAVASSALTRAPLLFVSCLLAVEFLDEIVDGTYRGAWPLIRDDLQLSYAQIGVLLSVPGLVGSVLEVGVGVLGDVWNRRALVTGGGALFALSLVLMALGTDFWWLLAALTIFSPAGGAFVSLSQAALMDAEPARREQNMARWTFVGSVANVAGPLAVGAAVYAGVGWRGSFLSIAALTLVSLVFVRRLTLHTPARVEGTTALRGLAEGLRAAFVALRRREVLRWLVLLGAADLMLDVLAGFLALYFVDVVGASPAGAAAAVMVWTGVGLAGDFLLIPLLGRVGGLSYLRASASAALVVFPVFMLAPGGGAKLALAGLLGLTNAGWYAILQARLYAEMPGQSGTVIAIANVGGFAGCLTPLALGLFAEAFGLQATMWLLVAAPLALLAGLRGAGRAEKDEG